MKDVPGIYIYSPKEIDMLDLGIANGERLQEEADRIAVKLAHYLCYINVAGDLGADATARKLKTGFMFRTDGGYLRDVEITVTVVEKPHKLAGGMKAGNGTENDGQASFDIDG